MTQIAQTSLFVAGSRFKEGYDSGHGDAHRRADATPLAGADAIGALKSIASFKPKIDALATRQAGKPDLRMCGQKRTHAGNDFFVRILKDVMAGIGQPQGLGVRESGQKFVQELGGEAPVTHPPDK